MKDLSNPYNAYGFTDANGACTLNPYWIMENFRNLNDVSRLMGNFNVTYKPLEWGTFQERLDTYTDRRRTQTPNYKFVPTDNTIRN